MPRVDIRTCISCRFFNTTVISKDLIFQCDCKDEEKEKTTRNYTFIIGKLKILDDKKSRICYEKDFVFPSGCPYLLEQTLVQDRKGLIK